MRSSAVVTKDLVEDIEIGRRIALELLGVRDRSVKEMRDCLRRRRCADDVIAQVVIDFESMRMLDDRAFARRWIENRIEHRPEGVLKLILDLTRRGVDRKMVEEVLAEFNDHVGSEEAALLLLNRVKHRYRGLEHDVARRRIFGLLARRGFDSVTARAAVNRVLEETEQEAMERSDEI